MKQREQARIQVLNTVLEHHLSIGQAAEIMGVSERHAKRLLAAYRKDGPAALANGNRGRRPHNAVPVATATAVVKLASNHYAGANHSHFTELLQEREGIDLNRPTVRRILVKSGLGSPRSRRSQQHRFRRKRMPQEGMLIQVDGSPHPWLEERGPKFVLLLAVDYATGIVAQAIFHPSEDTRGYLVLLEGLVRQWGIPLALYSDRHAAFKYNARQGPVLYESTQFAPGDAGTGHPADIRSIPAGQRPGRADGVHLPGPAGHRTPPGWRCHHGPGQPGTSGVPARFNHRFAVAAEQAETAYRPVPEDLSLTETVSIRHTRKVARDNTVKYQWRVLQLLPGAERPSYAGLQVELLERADGELMLRYQGEPIDFQEATLRSPALWGEGSGSFPSPEGPEVAGDQANGHLDGDQRKLLAGLESSVRRKAKAKKATGQGRGTQGNPLRHQLHRTPTPPSRLAGKRFNRPGAKVSRSGPLPRNWVCRATLSESTPKRRTRPPNYSAPRNGSRQRPWPKSKSPPINQGDIFAFQKRGHSRWTTTYSSNSW